MKIGIDIMGGDYAPKKTILGAIEAREILDESCQIYLFGDRDKIILLLKDNKTDPSEFEIIHCSEVIEMGENPAKSFASKTKSSIVVGYHFLKSGQIDGFTSAGNTGAMMVGAMHVVKSIPGVIRPGIATTLPNLKGGQTVIIDVGINPDCRPDVLYQYGILGSIYSKNIYNIENPTIGLLNVGTEEGKGNLLTKNAYELMKDSNDFNFIGNVEGNDIFNDEIDVIVCDGFVGNVILKEAEAFYKLLKMRNINDEFVERLNFEHYGGIPILGINQIVTIGHGISGSEAIKNLILQTKKEIETNLTEKLKEAFN
ncbi:phosphate acyltransferase PlsX [Bacteroidota bacterium]